MTESAVPAPPDPAPRRPLALSPSRAGDFRQCPLLYRFRAIDRIPETPSRAQVRGTVTHTVLEQLFELPRPERSPARARALVAPALDAALAADPTLAEVVPEAEREEFLAAIEPLLAHYFRIEDPSRFDPESVEQRIETRIEDDLLLRGFIDRVDVAPTGEVRVVDYKTGKRPPERFQAQALFQMKFYALMWWRTRGELPTQLLLIYLGDGTTLRHAPEAAELERFETVLTALWDAIRTAGRTGDFPPRRSKLCDWCDHRAICPEFGGTPPPYPGWPGETEIR